MSAAELFRRLQPTPHLAPSLDFTIPIILLMRSKQRLQISTLQTSLLPSSLTLSRRRREVFLLLVQSGNVSVFVLMQVPLMTLTMRWPSPEKPHMGSTWFFPYTPWSPSRITKGLGFSSSETLLGRIFQVARSLIHMVLPGQNDLSKPDSN